MATRPARTGHELGKFVAVNQLETEFETGTATVGGMAGAICRHGRMGKLAGDALVPVIGPNRSKTEVESDRTGINKISARRSMWQPDDSVL